MRFLIAADIVYQLMSTKLAGQLDAHRSSNELNQKNFGKLQENNYSTHRSAARESTNIYTIECIYRKDKAPKATTTGLSQKCADVAPNGPLGPALLC